jgi:hypothetical protein
MHQLLIVIFAGVYIKQDDPDVEGSLSIKDIFHPLIIEIYQFRMVVSKVGNEIMQPPNSLSDYFEEFAPDWYNFKHIPVLRVLALEVIPNI